MTFLDTGEAALEYNFDCKGTEKRFVECGLTSAKRESCSFNELVGVKCTTDAKILALPRPGVDFQIPLDSDQVDVRMCEDISTVAQALWDSDVDRLPADAVQLNLQAQLDGFGVIQDKSPEKSGKSYVLDTSGLEHWVGEFKSSGAINTACPAFEWQNRIKRKATFFLRSSPAYDIAVYSLCFSMFRNEHCPIAVDGESMIIKTHGKSGHIATAYVM
ncbi:poly(U)-specific endoribonuclease-like [Elysia marginata]|uniref:Uridylate-specific endoribonuclease n=1 Tax=Elysia marginata TaxID=1093978 RepID=A0AAV4FRQ6_9GAST|nr:poly(U)-specific endoribonuclease-like [Elysia marginata]